MRPVSSVDFNRILSIGLAEDQPELPRSGEAIVATLTNQFAESTQAPFIFEQDRVRVTQLSSGIVRQRLFRRLILQAYDERCAITGWKLINGGGRAEVDAPPIFAPLKRAVREMVSREYLQALTGCLAGFL